MDSLTKSSITTELRIGFQTASEPIRKKIESQDYGALAGDLFQGFKNALTRTFDNLDALFSLEDPEAQLDVNQKSQVAQWHEGSTNQGEYFLGKACRNIVAARILAEKISGNKIENWGRVKKSPILRDLKQLSEFVNENLIPLMNKEQTKYHQRRFASKKAQEAIIRAHKQPKSLAKN